MTSWQIDDQAWIHDDETGGEVAMLVDGPGIQAGIWRPGRSGPGPVEVVLDHTEVVLVLSGTGQLQVDDDSPLELTPGTVVRITAGARTRWTVDDAFRELWLYL